MTGAQRAADPLDRVAPTRRSRSGVRLGIGLRVPTLRRLVCIELVLALLCAAAIAAGFSMRTVLVVAVLTAAIPFVTTAGRTPFDWAVTAIRYASGWAPSVGTTTDHIDVDGNPFGVHRNGDLVSCILELRPAEGAATRLGRAGATTDSTLDLGTLARCLTQHDISLSGIDVVSHGRRTASGTPAADVYERLIGPLPAVADRTVWVTVTADLRSNTEAVRVRGGGSVGAAATVRIATERVARALDAQGVASAVLTRNQIRDAVLHPELADGTFTRRGCHRLRNRLSGNRRGTPGGCVGDAVAVDDGIPSADARCRRRAGEHERLLQSRHAFGRTSTGCTRVVVYER